MNELHSSSPAASGVNNTHMSSFPQSQSSMLYHLDENEKLVAVRGNAVVTCCVGNEGEGQCQGEARGCYRQSEVLLGMAERPINCSNQGQNLPPLAPVTSKADLAASTIPSINSQISSGASSGTVGASPHQSPSASPTLQMLQELGGMTASPTELIGSALGVTPVLQF